MIKQIAAIVCAEAMLFVLSAMAGPALASDTLGTFLSNCSDALIEPLCLVSISDEVEIVAQVGDACIPDSVSDDQASRAVLQRLRTEVANEPDIASHDNDDEENNAIAALWPC